MSKSTPDATSPVAAPVAATTDATVAAIIAAANVENTTETAVTEAVHNTLRSVSAKGRTAVQVGILSHVTDIPTALLATVVSAITSAPTGRDPKVAAAEQFTNAVRQHLALIAVATENGISAPTGVGPTDADMVAARAKVAKWLTGKGSTGSGDSRTAHVAKVLPRGTYSHQYADGTIGTCQADGKTPDRVTYGGEVVSVSMAARLDAKAHGLTGADTNGWSFWFAGKTGTGETAAAVGVPVPD